MRYSDIHVSRDELVCDQGIVSAGTTSEAETGVEILEKGGNAVAAVFAACVVDFYNCGLGGNGFMSVYMGDSRGTATFDWAPRVPYGTLEDAYELEDGESDFPCYC